MLDFYEYLKDLFFNLNVRIQKMNTAREKKGLSTLGEGEAILLGYTSLATYSELSTLLALSERIEVNIGAKMHHSIKLEMQAVMDEAGLLYDPEAEEMSWIPEEASFEEIYSYGGILVKRIDAESALLSLALQEANESKALIERAIKSGKFPRLAERIRENGA